jgi:hypothetical protein
MSNLQIEFRTLTPRLVYEEHLPGNIGRVWTSQLTWFRVALWFVEKQQLRIWGMYPGRLLHQSYQVTVIYSAIFNFWSGSLHVRWERWVQSITEHTYTIATHRCVLLVCRKAHKECNCVERDTELGEGDGIAGIVKVSMLFVTAHKLIWISPDGKTHNQIDHTSTGRRRHSGAPDVRSFKRPDCDTDHYIVVAKVRDRLAVSKRTRPKIWYG